MDTIIQKDREDMEIIAKSNNDYPVLMINQNRYLKNEFVLNSLRKLLKKRMNIIISKRRSTLKKPILLETKTLSTAIRKAIK